MNERFTSGNKLCLGSFPPVFACLMDAATFWPAHSSCFFAYTACICTVFVFTSARTLGRMTMTMTAFRLVDIRIDFLSDVISGLTWLQFLWYSLIRLIYHGWQERWVAVLFLYWNPLLSDLFIIRIDFFLVETRVGVTFRHLWRHFWCVLWPEKSAWRPAIAPLTQLIWSFASAIALFDKLILDKAEHILSLTFINIVFVCTLISQKLFAIKH